MIATERLYLTSDRRRVVEHNNRDASFLLAAPGVEIKKEFVPLVEAFYAAKAKAKPAPEPEPFNPIPIPPASELDLSADDTEGIENRETRIPKAFRKRGRPRKQDTTRRDDPAD